MSSAGVITLLLLVEAVLLSLAVIRLVRGLSPAVLPARAEEPQLRPIVSLPVPREAQAVREEVAVG
jgi:hypothetical protein